MNEPIKGYHCDLDCSNSPKAQFIKDFNSWFVTGDTEKILAVLTPDVVWEMVGEKPLTGLEAVRESFIIRDGTDDLNTLMDMTVEGILTHGREAVSYGSMTMSDGTKYQFSDRVEFQSLSKDSKIRKVVSFVIKVD